MCIMSAIAAPRGEVTMPMRRGKRGSGRLRSAANSPSAASFFLSCSKASCSAPRPCGSSSFHQQLIFAARFVYVDTAARQHRQPILRLELPVAMGGAEGDALHLRLALFQGEIVVAAGGQFHARRFRPRPRHRRNSASSTAPNGGVQFADAEDPALRRQIEFERELLHALIMHGGVKRSGCRYWRRHRKSAERHRYSRARAAQPR